MAAIFVGRHSDELRSCGGSVLHGRYPDGCARTVSTLIVRRYLHRHDRSQPCVHAAWNLRSGLINITGISIVAIVMTNLSCKFKMEAARTAAYEAISSPDANRAYSSMEALTTYRAYEVNQPLAAIVTSGNACQRWLGQDSPIRQSAPGAF